MTAKIDVPLVGDADIENMSCAEHADEAIKLLTVALIYVEDGAPSTALVRTEKAVEHLKKMVAIRAASLGKL